jgi:hypothetical protein
VFDLSGAVVVVVEPPGAVVEVAGAVVDVVVEAVVAVVAVVEPPGAVVVVEEPVVVVVDLSSDFTHEPVLPVFGSAGLYV